MRVTESRLEVVFRPVFQNLNHLKFHRRRGETEIFIISSPSLYLVFIVLKSLELEFRAILVSQRQSPEGISRSTSQSAVQQMFSLFRRLFRIQKSKPSTISQALLAKRRETEEPEDKGKSPPVQSTSYWFDDGGVIIQAENTQYRVHQSLLSRHSTIFNDMFSLPQPAMDPGPTSEGCPVIFLSDKATDLEHVLSVIYDGIRRGISLRLYFLNLIPQQLGFMTCEQR